MTRMQVRGDEPSEVSEKVSVQILAVPLAVRLNRSKIQKLKDQAVSLLHFAKDKNLGDHDFMMQDIY